VIWTSLQALVIGPVDPQGARKAHLLAWVKAWP
jgi:hypothetical protein